MEKALDNEPIVVYYNQAVSDDGTDKESVVTWSSIEVVITSTTGNRVAVLSGSRVRIPPTPPKSRLSTQPGFLLFAIKNQWS